MTAYINDPHPWAIQTDARLVVRTIKCPECFKPLGQDDAYGHDCEV